ncbi:hypothetical protein [uncultured Desulfovibrio sp.]|uniref:hypothetical protein n=2 Tax=uncultured Desulfovibrio sp. TaxID=167968 RepID=UPI0025FC4505|nr:hypothetical protein [uncultured Desulfovibrio sp.]
MPRFPHILSCHMCLALCLGFGSGVALAASAAQGTGYDSVPAAVAAPSRQNVAPLPPQLPAYLPNGAVNLDEAWVQDGGARLYWNTLLVPRQLKMAGATWIDPALTPQLLAPPAKTAPPRRWKPRRKAAPKSVVTVKAPEGAGSTALICVPAAPGLLPLPFPTTAKAAAPAAPTAPAEPAKASPTPPTAPATPTAQAPTMPVPAPPLQ